MDKPRLYALITYTEDGSDTSIFFDREEAIDEFDRASGDVKVVGEVEEYKSFGQGSWGEWYGIKIIKEKQNGQMER
jgi:hypothetical protein